MPVPGAVADVSVLSTAAVKVPAPGGDLDAYMACPTGAGSHPGVIVIHEAFGLVEHTRDLARRLANLGMCALAPDLYCRVGPPNLDDMGSVFSTMLSLHDDEVVIDLEACAVYLRGLHDANGKVGCIGFCSGGRQTLLFACQNSALDAAVDCWGGFIDRARPDAQTTDTRPTPVIDLVDGLAAPLLAVGGVEDDNPSPAVLGQLLARIAAANKTATVKVFADAGHAFLADYRDSYRDQPAHELWADVTGFFTHHLR